MFFVDPYNDNEPAIIHDTAANWTAGNRVLQAGQFGVETDTQKFKIGDGVTAWNSLVYSTYTIAQITALLAGKQDVLTIDSVPTDGSLNPVQSNGVFDKLALKSDIIPRSGSVASSATPSIDVTLYDCYSITALATNITSVTISGTPGNFQPLLVRVLDNGTSRTVTLGSAFFDMGGGVTFSTTISKYTLIGCIYNATKGKFGVVRITTEV